MIREDIKMGKSLVSQFNSEMFKKKEENKEKEKKEEAPAAEKVNKFQKFMEKKEINGLKKIVVDIILLIQK